MREIQEEVGVNIELGDLEFVNIMHRSCEKDKPQRISCVFVIKKRS
ncbi:hypothetical protein GW750_02285 [bacterium]|nr:hypothetical protein [bacterium]